MKIRSITLFSAHDPRRCADPKLDHLLLARQRLGEAGYEVQTLRWALCDPAALLPASMSRSTRRRQWLDIGQALEQTCTQQVDYASIGAFASGDELAGEIPELLAATQRVFAAASMSDDSGVNLETVRRLGQVVHDNARLGSDGFANLRFAALSRVPPGVPFLPAAYHGDGMACLAVAAECADLVQAACAAAANLDQARGRLIASIESHAARIESALAALTDDLIWSGIDFSPAPYPSADCSLAAAIESLGVAKLGQHGSTATAAFLASTLDSARFRRAGFNGLFFPVLEDARLAARAGEGKFGLKDLLLWSTVCGTGLDTVPLPGDTSAAELAAILLDVAALGVRLSKPLTARLMPIPGRSAGDALHFDFPYFAPGRVLPHAAAALASPLATSRHLPLSARRRGEPDDR